MTAEDFFRDNAFELSLRPVLEEQMRRNHDAIERACELMLVTPGACGVLVEPQSDGSVVASLSKDVPFGEIHWMPWPMMKMDLPRA